MTTIFFCYGKNMDKVTKSFGCGQCGKLLTPGGDLNKHVDTRDGIKTTFIYAVSIFRLQPTSFKTLQDNRLDLYFFIKH